MSSDQLSNPVQPQGGPEGSNNKGAKKGIIIVLIGLGVLAFMTALAVIAGFVLWGDRSEESEDTYVVSDTPDRIRRQSRNPESENADPDEEIVEAPAEEDEYISQHLLCSGYEGNPDDYYYFDFTYPAFVTVVIGSEALGGDECSVEFSYEGSIMWEQFDVGEAYPRTLEPGYEELLESGGRILVRTSIEMYDGDHSYSYGWKQDDANCAPSEFDPELSAPCALPIHPFAPGATMVGVTIPGTVGASELSDIVEMFDGIALSMTGGIAE